MKKTLISTVAAMMAGVALAAANDTLITFSTKGPDTYADGTTVLDKECYALVWDTGAFAVAADGSATGGEIVLTAPVARKGRCPKVLFEVDAKDVAEKYTTGGSWKVYLLDTRRFGENGVTLAPLKGGKPTVVNAAAAVTKSKVSVSSGAPNAVVVDAGTRAATESALPEDVPQPVIAGIELVGDQVFVTVENTVPYVAYDLAAGERPEAIAERVNRPRHGGTDGTVILVSPIKEDGAFFKVRRN